MSRTTTLAPIELRPSDTIARIDGGWFRARWHFSFSYYEDPENMGIGALRVLNHDTLTPGSFWPPHPHEDVEGITYVLRGEFAHADSLGNGGVLRNGGVQRMTLGSGATHSEGNHSASEETEFLQIWIIPDRRGLTPSVQQRQYTEFDRINTLLQVLKPEVSEEDGLDVHQEARMFVSQLEDGRTLQHEIPAGHGGYLYLIQGRMRLNGQPMATGDAAYLRDAGAVVMEAGTTCELVLIDTVLDYEQR